MIFLKKKTIILIIIALIVVVLVKNKQEKIMIPTDAIRIRIIANSNSDIDIEKKKEIRKNLEEEIYNLLKDAKTSSEARNLINENLDKLNILVDDKTNSNYDLSFGKNYFPRKVYKGIIYEEGEYESLVVTLGKGNGDNWWCVLFPPLCLLEGNEDTKDVEYRFFVKDLIDKYKSS